MYNYQSADSVYKEFWIWVHDALWGNLPRVKGNKCGGREQQGFSGDIYGDGWQGQFTKVQVRK